MRSKVICDICGCIRNKENTPPENMRPTGGWMIARPGKDGRSAYARLCKKCLWDFIVFIQAR